MTSSLPHFLDDIYTVRHKLTIAPIVSLKNEGSFPVMNIFLFYLLEEINWLQFTANFD